MKKVLLLVVLVMVGCESTSVSSNNESENTSWVFVANEGVYGGEEDGYLSMIDNFGNITETGYIG